MASTFRVKQKTSAIYTATLKDETGTVIPLSELATLTITLYNAEVVEPSPTTGNIINSRNLENCKNLANVTFHATSGLLTWNIQALDNVIVNEELDTELHVARFDFTYGTPTKDGSHEVRLRVVNLRKVS